MKSLRFYVEDKYTKDCRESSVEALLIAEVYERLIPMRWQVSHRHLRSGH